MLCIFNEQIWLQIGNAMEKNKLYFDQKEMLKMVWYSIHMGFWTCQFQWHRFWGSTFRCFHVTGYMYALSWKLLIIWLLLEYFATLLKILHLEKLDRKCSIFLHQLCLFLMERSRAFFLDKDQISSEERIKGRGKKGYGRRSLKWGLLSHKLLVRQTSNHHHCNWHAQKPICRDFQVISSSSSWSKTTLCIFKEEIWLPNRKCYGKINSVLILSQQREALSLSFSQHLVQVINCRGQHSMCRVNYFSQQSPKIILLTSVHNDADNADATNDADDYNRVIGIAQLKAFSCTKNKSIGPVLIWWHMTTVVNIVLEEVFNIDKTEAYGKK